MPDTSMRVHLTKRVVDATRPAATDVLVWDDEVPGFGLRVKPNGLKSYVLQYRNAVGRSRRLTVGKHGVLTAEGARNEARRQRARVAEGHDPATERAQARHAETFEAFAKRYLSHHAELHKKPASVRNDRLLLRLHVEPALKGRKVAEIGREDITRLHQSLKAHPYAANRTVALLSKMMNLAEKWGVRSDGTNPCRHVQKFKETRRQRFLSAAELLALGKVLDAVYRENVEHPSVVPAIRLLLFTGARRGEMLGLRWEHVDWESNCLNLPESKTGAKTIHLSPPAREVLDALRRQRTEKSVWVLPGRTSGGALVGLPHAWQRIRKRAKLGDLRLHDLRHSFASVAAATNMSLPMIGALLGHSQPQTTQRYAHLAADPLKEAAERIGERILAMMRPGVKLAQVVALKKGRRSVRHRTDRTRRRIN